MLCNSLERLRIVVRRPSGLPCSCGAHASLPVAPRQRSPAESKRQARPVQISLACKATTVVDTAPAPITPHEDVQDDLTQLLAVLPPDITDKLEQHPRRADLLEIVLDLGRQPEARFLSSQGELLRQQPVTHEELQAAVRAVGQFGDDNRAGIEGTLHRISAMRSRRGDVVGLTCRVGRAVTGHVDMVQDILEGNNSILFLGRPGVGKTTVIREIARVLADVLHKRVVIVDTSNEIGGDGDVPHPAIGGARRMQVHDVSKQHHTMIEAVENHMPQVVVVDEIGTEAEALACRTIAERGVTLIATAHGLFLENLIKNPTLSDLVGGIQSVTLGDETAKARGCQKSVLERRAAPTFPIVLEMRDRQHWVAHSTADSVDALLLNQVPHVQLRRRDAVSSEVSCDEVAYDQVDAYLLADLAARKAAAAAAAAATAGDIAVPGSASTSSSSSPISSLDEQSIVGSAAGSSGNLDGVLEALLQSTNSSGDSVGSSDSVASLEAAAVDPWAWVQKFKQLSQAEGLQEAQVIKYLGGPTGLVRPQGASFLHGSSAPAPVNSAAGGERSKKGKRRAAKAHAKQGRRGA